MVEAAIAFPLAILTAVLLLRVFSFYLEILSTGARAHIDAAKASEGYSGAVIRKSETEETVRMLRGGILRIDLTKEIRTVSYMINEDLLVRAGDIVD